MAREAAGLNGGLVENLEAAILEGAALMDQHSVEQGLATAQHAIGAAEQKSQQYLAAQGRLTLAEALWRNRQPERADKFARSALAFFDPRRIWEAVWRCRRLSLGADQIAAAKEALAELERIWPAEQVRSYLARPDLKELALL
ncbi:MAG: hypothetical protein JO323_13465 [Acidobacteriia bacterium]|nr:hypothetical protein [Terriglobia bacterium]